MNPATSPRHLPDGLSARLLPAIQRKPALAAIGLGIFTYLFFVTQVLLHNHSSRFPWVSPGGIGSGRWFSGWIGWMHYGADVPVLLPVTGVIMGVASALLVLRAWRLELGGLSAFLVLALIITYPANLSHFYYTFMTPLFFGSILMAALAFFLAGRLDPLRIAAAAVLVLLMMATYQLSLSLLVTVSVLAAIAAIVMEPGREAIRRAIIAAAARAIAVGIGGVAYRLSLAVSGEAPPRTIEYTHWSAIPARVWEVVSFSFEHLVVTQPELMTGIKLTLLALLVAAVAASLYKVRRSTVSLAALIVLWPAAVIATKTTFFFVVPDGTMWEYRYSISMGYLYAFALALLLWLLRTRLNARRLVQVVAVFIVVQFVQADLVRQGVLWRGQTHDLAIANRVLARIEQLPGIDYSKTYDLIRVGRYAFYRMNLLKSDGHDFYRLGDSHMDIGEISDRWVDEEVFRLLGSGINFKSVGTDIEFSAKIAQVQKDLLPGRRHWPAHESVFIDGDRIIVFMQTE